MHSTCDRPGTAAHDISQWRAYDSKRVFSPATVNAMISDQNQRIHAPWGLGWALGRSPVWNFFGDLSLPRHSDMPEHRDSCLGGSADE